MKTPWTRTSLSSIGEIEDVNPWTEVVYKWGRFTLVHWHQRRKSKFSSSLNDPEHTWRLYTKGTTVRLVLQYGTAPR